jgi:dipeptidyl aminopeptidase/acylaminoacyl peptidase
MELLFHDRRTTLVGIRYNRDKPRTLWLDDRFRKIQQTIDRRYGNKTNIIQAWTEDLGKVLFYSYNEETPGRIYIHYVDEKKMAVQSFLAPELENFKLGKTEVIQYKARDGHPVEAYLTRPPDAGAALLPLVIMPHGGPVVRDNWEYSPVVQAFATRGYAVVQPNDRGSTGYGRNHLNSGFNALATLMIDDMADGALEMIGNGTADRNRIFIFGESYGGYAAVMSAIRYHDLYKAGISIAAPLDLVKQIKSHKENDQYFAYDFWRDLAGDPGKETKALREISPYYRIGEIRIPLLIFHGADDPVIAAEQVREFEKIKDQAPAGIQTMIFKDEGHGFSVQSNNVYLLEKSLQHFQNTPGPGAKNGHQ